MPVSPRIPWELVERIIGHSGDNRKALCSLSRTCRQLRPRSLCLMVANIDIVERDQVIAFCDFLEAYPQLCPLVHSIRTSPTTFMPVPFLHMLPNLTDVTLRRPFSERTIISLPMSVLTCYRMFGSSIKALHLHILCFKTLQDLCRVLLAFTGIQELNCGFLDTSAAVKSYAELERNKLRISTQLSLKALTVSTM